MKHVARAFVAACALALGFVRVALAVQVLTFTGINAEGDCYADGSMLLAGECYAVVWQRSGVDFRGFNADGALVDPENAAFFAVLSGARGAAIGERLGAPYSHCQTYSSQVSSGTISKYSGYDLELYALDTRVWSSGVASLAPPDAKGRPGVINSYVKVMDLYLQSDMGSVPPSPLEYTEANVTTVSSVKTEKLVFRTIGDDCYAGAVPKSVPKGECYALVWRRAGAEDPEFAFEPAEPAPAITGKEDSWLAGYYPVATNDGAKSWCPDVTIAAGALPFALATNGTWTVYLLDTRDSLESDAACGFDPEEKDRPKQILAYAPVAGLTDFTLQLTDKEDVFADLTATDAAAASEQTEKPVLGIVCEGNGGTPVSQTIERTWGETYGDLSAVVFTRTGYAQVGWATEDGSTITSTTPVYSDEPLLVQWDANNYSVAFNVNGGSGTMEPQAFVYDQPQALTVCTFTRTGYGFAGWATEEEAAVVYADGEVVSNLTSLAGQTVTLSAVWSADDNTVTFDGNGGTASVASLKVKTDAELGDLPTATRKGYTLAGWFTAREGGEKVTADTVITASVTCFAQWTANEYEVGFNPRGGSGEMADQPMTWDEEAALYSNLYARVGYAFLGWTDDQEELEEVLYYDGVVVSNLTDVADGMFPLYAVWEANRYSVAFDANGGVGEMGAQEFIYDQQQALASNEFQKEDYYFVGWATEKTGEVVYSDGEKVVNLASEEGESVRLYAVWSLVSVKRIVPGAKVSFSTEDEDVFGEKLVNYTVTGLPDGLKYDRNKGTISGSVTKEKEVGTHQVVFAKGTDEREMQLLVAEIPTISVALWGEKEGATSGCDVTGEGAYLVGKKATLKATMPKATAASTTIFLGWYRNGEPWPDEATCKKTSVTYTMTEADADIRLVARFGIETADNLVVKWSGVGVEGRAFVTGVAGAEDGMPVDVSTVDGSSFSGVKSVRVVGLPGGMSYDAKSGCIVGAPTKANVDSTVKITVTTVAGVVREQTFDVRTVPMAAAAAGTFNGFVVRDAGAGVWGDVGTFTLTVKEDGKLSAKAVTSSKSLSFSGKSWDSISAEDGTYRATLATSGKDPVTLKLKLDPNAPWNGDQLTGALDTDGVTAQRKVFGTPWYFSSVSGDEENGWVLAYTTDAKAAALTVTLALDGATKISGALAGKKDAKGKATVYKVSASGSADVSQMTNGVFIADFAPVLTVGGKKKVLSVHTRLWMDRSNAHREDDIGIGDVKFTE